MATRTGRAHRAVTVCESGRKGTGTCSGMSIVFVSAECGPWSKTGGLGDVLGGLPPALAVSTSSLSLLVNG